MLIILVVLLVVYLYLEAYVIRPAQEKVEKSTSAVPHAVDMIQSPPTAEPVDGRSTAEVSRNGRIPCSLDIPLNYSLDSILHKV